jgi:membrane protease YdiL (CAAX protease family)
MNPIISFIKRQSLLIFFALTFALDGVATLLLASDSTILPFALVLIPTVTALALTALTDGWAGVKALLGRVVRWRVGLRWYAVVLGLPVVVALAIVGSAVLLGAPAADLFGKTFTPATLIVVALVLLPALLEELGWRGYALPKLLAARSALTASLVLGALWAAFHLPLYLPGQMYDGVPLWPLPTYIIATSFLLTWVFVNTRGSVLMVSLLHAALNAVTPLTWGIDPVVAWELRAVVLAVAALVLIAIAGPRLTHDERDQAEQPVLLAEPVAKV